MATIYPLFLSVKIMLVTLFLLEGLFYITAKVLVHLRKARKFIAASGMYLLTILLLYMQMCFS